MEYNKFVDLFKETVEKWIPETKEKLLRHTKYTKERFITWWNTVSKNHHAWLIVMLKNSSEKDMKTVFLYCQHIEI